ncbi:hypothetical protein [Oceanidesulfovibrio marinus]|uniref:hypothetical protein n=1 Tax=Oceanidesulfovibrio marinus TaxID=370038 RepID=UPI001184D2C1|nr:hypothetical protein [Oceanidesulfovibrio marinus]
MNDQKKFVETEEDLFQSGDPLNEDKLTHFSARYSQISEQDFRPITFDDNEQARPIPNLKMLLKILEKERVLIIAGGLQDKRGVSRRCGWEFAALQSDQNQEDQSIAACELLTSSSLNEDFFSAFSNKKEPTVFVITKVEPSIINNNVSALRSAIKDRHWVVIATVRTKHAWQLDASLEHSWIEPTEGELYNEGDLMRYLDGRLDGHKHQLQAAIDTDDPIRDCAQRLGSPEAIDAFVYQISLHDPNEVLSVDDLITHALSNQQAISTWFHHRLTPREKIIAIALALFENVDERVAFASIEKLMGSAWRNRDTALQFIDYGDLVNIREFFEFEDDSSSYGRLKALGDETRSALLKAAWQTHRRLIIASLPVLVQLVLDTLIRSTSLLDTLETDRQLNYYQDSIAETLGEIALLSMADVEPHLLTLIASGSIEAHNVVATTLRRVHLGGRHNDLFEMLSNWRTDSRSISFVDARTGESNSYTVYQLIGSAMSTIMGRLALENPTDSLDSEIIRLIRAYASSNDPLIVTRMSQSAMPTLCSVHTMQMVDLLPDLLDRIGNSWKLVEWFVLGSGFGLGLALRYQRKGLAPVLIKWINEGISETQKGGYDSNKVSLREKKLAVSAISFAVVRSTDLLSSGPSAKKTASPTIAVQVLTKILEAERHPFVRSVTMLALNILLKEEFQEASCSMSKIVETLTAQERSIFIEDLIDLHCYQRSQQKGGDRLLRVGEYDCPVWYDKTPENTSVQATMFTWAESATSPSVSSFAADVVLGIRRIIERSQEAKQKEMIEEREKEEKHKRELASRKAPELLRHKVRLSFFQRNLIVRWATIGSKEIRPAVEGMMASLVSLDQKEQAEIFDRYRSEGSESLSKTVKATRRSLFIDKYTWAIVLISLLIFGLLGVWLTDGF